MRMTTDCRHHRNTRGFTLMEVMIALFVFSLLMVMFASSLLVAKSASTINGQYAQAISLGQHKIDQLRAVGYARLTYQELCDPGIIDATPNAPPYRFDSATNDDQVPTYLPNPTATLNIQPYGADARVKLVTVTITWKSNAKRAANSQVVLNAQIANSD